MAVPVITPITSTIEASTALKITLTPTHSLDTTTKFTITFPSAYVLTTTCTLGSLVNVNSAATCSVSSQTITISSLLSTAFSKGSGTTLSF